MKSIDRIPRLLLGAALLGALSACSSSLKVADITDVEDGQHVSGIPFRVPNGYVAKVYYLEGGKAKEHHSFEVTLPDPKRLYAINFGSDLLSDHSLELTFHEDGTLEIVDLTETQKATEVLDELTTQIGAFETAKTAADAAKDAEDDAETAATAAEAAALVTALAAYNDALVAEAELADLLSGADGTRPTQTQISQAEAKVKLTKLQANVAYQTAGLPEPFPGVFP